MKGIFGERGRIKSYGDIKVLELVEVTEQVEKDLWRRFDKKRRDFQLDEEGHYFLGHIHVSGTFEPYWSDSIRDYEKEFWYFFFWSEEKHRWKGAMI